MDTALDYSCRLKETINQAKMDIVDLSKQLSQLDLAIQDILHCVELEPIGLERAYSCCESAERAPNKASIREEQIRIASNPVERPW